MNRYLVMITAVALVLLTSVPVRAGTLSGAATLSGARPAADSWQNAEEVPGTAALNSKGYAVLNSVSCASAGNCSAGGSYDGSSGVEAFAVSEVKGVWGKAAEVPNIAALNRGGDASLFSVSCTSAGDCSAGGWYTDGSGSQQAFLVNQVNGVWGNAQEVPGTAALNSKGYAAINSVSCASPGNCGAGGYYVDGNGIEQAFVISEAAGTWADAEELPGIAATSPDGTTQVTSMSCPSPGSCNAGGTYTDSSSANQAFVESESAGVWGQAEEVPGTAALNQGGNAQVTSMSCTSPGNCGAGGYYTDSSGSPQGLAASEVNGTWGKAEEIPDSAFSHTGAEIYSVSCISPGNCGAGGYYTSPGNTEAFVVTENSGVWGQPEEVTGTTMRKRGNDAYVNSTSCAASNYCSAGGTYTDTSGHQQAFVFGEEVPGTAALNQGGDAQVATMSCVSATSCGAGGTYTDSSGNQQVFVVSQS